MQIPDTSLFLLGNSSPLAHTPFPCARGMTGWLKVIRNEPRRNERLGNSAFQGQGLAVHFFLDHQPHHIILSKRPVSTASRQKGRRQAFSPSLLHTRVLPAPRRAGARGHAAAAAAPRGALDADTPLPWPGAASPFFSRLLGSTGRALPLRLRLERQRAEPVVGTAHGKEKGLLLPALSVVTSLEDEHPQAQS